MKYERTRTIFILPDGMKVRPFDGEKKKVKGKSEPEYQLSWSAGFTHYEDIDTGNHYWCGTSWFEKNATKIGGVAR